MNWISVCMVLAIVFTVLYALHCVREMKKQHGEVAYKREILVLAAATAVYMLLLYMSDAVYRSVFLLLAIVNIVEYMLLILGSASRRKIFCFAAKVLAIAAVLEATVFNLPSYHLWLGDYAQQTLEFTDADVTGENFTYYEEEKTLLAEGEEETLVTFYDLDSMVGTISVDVFYGKDTFREKLIVDMTDETSQNYRYDIAKQDLVNYNGQTQIFPCHFSGKVGKLRLKFSGYDEDSRIMVTRISINEPIPFQVSWIRLLILVGLPLLVYVVGVSESFSKPLRQTRKLFWIGKICLLWVFLMLASLLMAYKIPQGTVMETFFKESGDQMTQELVDAFEHGQVSLLAQPDKKLVEMENPYDRGMRNSKKVNAKWDHVYYQGKYYSYYGIAPVILVFLPFHLLTGYYMSTQIAVLLFSLIGMMFLTLLYDEILKRWFSSVSCGMALAGQVILFSACGIWFCLGRPKFYEIAISAGFMFVTAGTWFLLTSNIVGAGKIRRVRLALSSLLLALAVLSRPTLALYCVCACVYYLYGIVEKAGCGEKKHPAGRHGERVITALCAFLPMMLLGLVQMWYNNVRFGSPFDFGIKYSLTINDFTHTQFHTGLALITVFNYLLAAPGFSFDYPFISTPFSKLGMNGYFFKDTGNTSGVLFLALPMFAWFFSRKALAKLPDRKTRIKSILLVGLPCLIMPVAITAAAWESGYAARYFTDFSWQMVLGAFAVLFFLYGTCKNTAKQEFVHKAMAFAALWSAVVCFVQVYNFSFPQSSYPYMASLLEQAVAFWK